MSEDNTWQQMKTGHARRPLPSIPTTPPLQAVLQPQRQEEQGAQVHMDLHQRAETNGEHIENNGGGHDGAEKNNGHVAAGESMVAFVGDRNPASSSYNDSGKMRGGETSSIRSSSSSLRSMESVESLTSVLSETTLSTPHSSSSAHSSPRDTRAPHLSSVKRRQTGNVESHIRWNVSRLFRPKSSSALVSTSSQREMAMQSDQAPPKSLQESQQFHMEAFQQNQDSQRRSFLPKPSVLIWKLRRRRRQQQRHDNESTTTDTIDDDGDGNGDTKSPEVIQEAMERKRQREWRRKREDFLTESQKFFNAHVLSLSRDNARTVLRTNKKVRSMWKKGLPPQTRGQIWQLAAGNDLRISRDLFLIIKNKQVDMSKRNHATDDSNNNNSNNNSNSSSMDDRDNIFAREQSISLIGVDLMRTFPALQFFQEGGPLYSSFREVLECYAKFRPDVGYVQGMSYLVAMLLLYMGSFEAFVVLANMLNASHFYSFFRMNADEISKHVEVIKHLMKTCLPSLHEHLISNLNINCHLFIVDWFLTLFAKSLPLDIAARVWDIYLCDGEIVLYRVTLGLLSFFSKTLLAGDFEECMYFFSHLSNVHDQIVEEDLFQAVERMSQKLTPQKLLNAKKHVGLTMPSTDAL